MELSLASSRLWPDLVRDLGEDVGLRQGGGITLCLTDDDVENGHALIEAQSASPRFEGRMLSPSEVFDLQPPVSRDIKGAVWSPHDGDVNWVKWTAALARGCERAGVDIRPNTRVTGIDRDTSGAVTGVTTNHGTIHAATVVCAAGVWSSRVARMAGVDLALRPVKGQILVTEPTDMICPVPMANVRQDPDGSFYLGVTHEEAAWDVTPTDWAFNQIHSMAASLVPAVSDLRIVRHFAGLRPMPQDGLPFLGPVATVPGFYTAVGHSGITLSPIHGKVIADLIVDGQTDVDIAAYDPLRVLKP
jgi:sarcosine oxidase subunit beta